MVVALGLNSTGATGLAVATDLNSTGASGLAGADTGAALNVSNSSPTTLDEAHADRHKNNERKR
ncbi:hypothetical protein ACIQVE_12400 [Pseudomonas sp. NPDC098747]|uniref:hypothetical protein n=1 Tax=Pseudomonas sp. NPDC098747 TaxID=3364487 RepID=UPI00383B9C86